jgi:hypothetical protein
MFCGHPQNHGNRRERGAQRETLEGGFLAVYLPLYCLPTALGKREHGADKAGLPRWIAVLASLPNNFIQ